MTRSAENYFRLVCSDHSKESFGGAFLKNCQMCSARLVKDGNLAVQKTEVSFLFHK